MMWGLMFYCGLVGPLRVAVEDRAYCPLAMQVAQESYIASRYKPRKSWVVVFTQEYIADGKRRLRGATEQSMRRIYVVSAEPRVLFHELHHAWDAEHGRWHESIEHARWTCMDWTEEYIFTRTPPTWTDVCP